MFLFFLSIIIIISSSSSSSKKNIVGGGGGAEEGNALFNDTEGVLFVYMGCCWLLFLILLLEILFNEALSPFSLIVILDSDLILWLQEIAEGPSVNDRSLTDRILGQCCTMELATRVILNIILHGGPTELFLVQWLTTGLAPYNRK